MFQQVNMKVILKKNWKEIISAVLIILTLRNLMIMKPQLFHFKSIQQIHKNANKVLYKSLNVVKGVIIPAIESELDRKERLENEKYKQYRNATNNSRPKIPNYYDEPQYYNLLQHEVTHLIYIFSKPNSYGKRTSVRNTWGRKYLFKNREIYKIVFILGLDDSVTTQNRLYQESNEFQDIVQGNFADTPENSGLKSLFALKWLQDFAYKKVKYAIRVNDDMFLNVFKLLDFMNSTLTNLNNPIGDMIMCPFVKEFQEVIQRGDCGKWCVHNYKDLPDAIYYPQYCHHDLWVYNIDMVKHFLYNANRTNYFFIEDVYLTGLVLPQIENVKIIDISFVIAAGLRSNTIHIPSHYPVVQEYSEKRSTREFTLIATKVPDIGTLHKIWNMVLDKLDPQYLGLLNRGPLGDSRASRN